MATVFDQLTKMSFDGIAFPISKCVTRGEHRIHTHEYPKAPGGSPEILGRKNYTFQVDAFFVQGAAGYPPNLWPNSLSEIRARGEAGDTATLHVPTIGDIQAKLRTWEQTTDFEKLLNGERASFTFEEDQTNDFLVTGIVNVTTSSLSATANDFFLLASVKTPNIFDQIQALVNSVIGLINTVQLYGNLLMNKINALMGLLSLFDTTVAALNLATNADLLEKFMALRDSAQKLQADSQRNSAKLMPYTTPKVMSISDVSRALYSSSAKTTALLKLNALEDPLNIPQGKTLLVLAA